MRRILEQAVARFELDHESLAEGLRPKNHNSSEAALEDPPVANAYVALGMGN